jgi:hypothetical protein
MECWRETGLSLEQDRRRSKLASMKYPRWLVLLFIVSVVVCVLATIALLASPFFATPKIATTFLGALSAGLGMLAIVVAQATRIAKEE